MLLFTFDCRTQFEETWWTMAWDKRVVTTVRADWFRSTPVFSKQDCASPGSSFCWSLSDQMAWLFSKSDSIWSGYISSYTFPNWWWSGQSANKSLQGETKYASVSTKHLFHLRTTRVTLHFRVIWTEIQNWKMKCARKMSSTLSMLGWEFWKG